MRVPLVCIKTTWSDDTITLSEPLEEWFAGWVMLTYSDSDFWQGQIRPVRAIFIRVQCVNETPGVRFA
jgi:hypothetical protein